MGTARRSFMAWADRRTLGLDELAATLTELGLQPGTTAMVHSSMDALGRRLPGVGPLQLIDLLRDMVGPEGTLLMPTSPFTGSQEEYARAAPVFQVRRTPSRLGLLSEVFRRQQDVLRSLHPTHSVAAVGPQAGELLTQHHCGTAFGPCSPFYKLGGDQLVLGLGVGVRQAFTLWHVVEELHPPTRRRVFSAASYPLEVVDETGPFIYQCQPLKAGVERDFVAIEKNLLKSGALQYQRPGGLLLAGARGRDFIAAGLAYCRGQSGA